MVCAASYTTSFCWLPRLPPFFFFCALPLDGAVHGAVYHICIHRPKPKLSCVVSVAELFEAIVLYCIVSLLTSKKDSAANTRHTTEAATAHETTNTKDKQRHCDANETATQTRETEQTCTSLDNAAAFPLRSLSVPKAKPQNTVTRSHT